VLDVVDFDAEMIEPAGAPVAAWNHVHADVAVAQHDRARGPGLARRLHGEEGFVEPAVQRILVGRGGDVVDARGHGPPPQRTIRQLPRPARRAPAYRKIARRARRSATGSAPR